jgi:hypothetical protein
MGRPRPSTSVRARLLAPIGLVMLLALIVSSCSSSASPGKSATSAKSTTTTSVLTPAILSRNLTINGHTYPVPSEDGVHAIDPSVATGGQIVLTNKGFLPYRLFVQLKQVITWTNLSSHPVRLTFLHLPIKSTMLAVGGTFTYSSPTLINFEYTSSSGYHGIVSIGSFTP